MRSHCLIAVIASAALAGAMALFQRRPTIQLQILSLPIAVLFLGALAYSVLRVFRINRIEQKERIWCYLALVSCLMAIVSVFSLGPFLNRQAFEQHLSRMTDFLTLARPIAPAEHASLLEDEIPEDLRDIIYVIHVKRRSASAYDAAFFYGAGFPVKHSAWYFSSDDTPPPRRDWPKQLRLQKNWFKVAD